MEWINAIGGIVMIAAGMISFILMVIAIIDILQSKNENDRRAVWAIVVIAFPFIGSIMYFIMGRKTPG